MGVSPTHELDVTDLGRLDLHASTTEVTTWRGRKALRLDGLVILPSLQLGDGSLRVQICAEGPAYPGIAFHIADALNYELAYAQPHTSGQWDAIQYDPVFHGSNTWQLYCGPAYQKTAHVPMGEWFELRVDVSGSRASVAVDEQPALVVERLAHGQASGRVGLWTYLPAYFCDLRVVHGPSALPTGVLATAPLQALDGWFLEGFGALPCEPSGVLSLNRYLPTPLQEAHLTRRFVVKADEPLELTFGFSDELCLKLDDRVLFTGKNNFSGMSDRASRGYVEPGAYSVGCAVSPGVHRLSAELKVSEGFGWGLLLALRGSGVRWLPAALG